MITVREETPAAPSAERAVLGHVMLWPEEMETLVHSVTPQHFASLANRALWDALVEARNRRVEPSLEMIASIMEAAGTWDRWGTYGSLSSVIDEAAVRGSLPGYVQILEEKRVSRNILEVGLQFQEIAYSGRSADEVASAAQEHFRRFAQGLPAKGTTISLGDLLDYAEEVADRRGDNYGFPAGLASIDSIAGRLEPGSLSFMIGLPGIGKTLVAMGLMRRQILESGLACGFISLEMGPQALGLRLASASTGMTRREFLKMGTRHAAWDKAKRKYATIKDRGFFAFDVREIHDIYIRGLQWINTLGIKVLYLDHLQEIVSRVGGDSRVQQVDHIIGLLKDLAIKGGVAVICLAQFNRRALTLLREGGSPWYESVRDSERINQSADRMWFILRDSKEAEDNWAPRTQEDVILRCVKNRNGPTGEMRLTIDYERQDIVSDVVVPF